MPSVLLLSGGIGDASQLQPLSGLLSLVTVVAVLPLTVLVWASLVVMSSLHSAEAKLGHFGLSLQCGTDCYPLECLPFWGCFAVRVTLASGLLPALHSLDACEGLTRAISTGLARRNVCRCLGESVRAWLGTVAMWRVSARLIGDCRYVALRAAALASQSALGWGLSLCGESVRAWLATVTMWRCGRCVASQSALGWGDSPLSVTGRCLGESVRAWLGTVAMWRVSARLIGDCRYVALRPLRDESIRAWLGTLAIERCGTLPWRVSPHLVGDCRYVAGQCLCMGLGIAGGGSSCFAN
ncbi:hypothetical protein ACLB2K_041796 [Fragaria x ananassa]